MIDAELFIRYWLVENIQKIDRKQWIFMSKILDIFTVL